VNLEQGLVSLLLNYALLMTLSSFFLKNAAVFF
jgi:hypothetical protein